MLVDDKIRPFLHCSNLFESQVQYIVLGPPFVAFIHRSPWSHFSLVAFLTSEKKAKQQAKETGDREEKEVRNSGNGAKKQEEEDEVLKQMPLIAASESLLLSFSLVRGGKIIDLLATWPLF